MNSAVESSWNDFLDALSKKEGEGVLTQVKFKLEDFIDRQVNIDKARKVLFKPEFNHLLKLYLGRISLRELSDKISAHEKNFIRAFGQDRFLHLKLLVSLKIMNEAKRPKKGLLAEATIHI